MFIPQDRKDVEELLCKQMALLAKESNRCEIADLCMLSCAMAEIIAAYERIHLLA